MAVVPTMTGTPTPAFPPVLPTVAPTSTVTPTPSPTLPPPTGALVVYWDGTSGDRIMIQYTGNGSEDIIISADPNNTGATRTKTVTLTTTMGTPADSRSLTISQISATGSGQTTSIPIGGSLL